MPAKRCKSDPTAYFGPTEHRDERLLEFRDTFGLALRYHNNYEPHQTEANPWEGPVNDFVAPIFVKPVSFDATATCRSSVLASDTGRLACCAIVP